MELYNPLDSYAYSISMTIDKNYLYGNLEEQQMMLPVINDNRKYVILINTEKLFVFQQVK